MFTSSGNRSGRRRTSPSEELIATLFPNGTVATFLNIPQIYKDLRIVVRGAGTTAATTVNLNVTFNNDSSAIYDVMQINNNAPTTVAAVQTLAGTSANLGSLPASTSPANTGGHSEFIVGNYSSPIFKKQGLTLAGVKVADSNGNIFIVHQAFWYRSILPIARVDVTLAAGNYVSGSSASLYGRY